MYKKILKELIKENKNAIKFYNSMLDGGHIYKQEDIYRTEGIRSNIRDIQNFIDRKIQENKSNIKIK
jgi:hypothetical protein